MNNITYHTCEGSFALSRDVAPPRGTSRHESILLPYKTLIDVDSAQNKLSTDAVMWSIRMGHTIARMNRNSEWMRPVRVVSYDLSTIDQHLEPHIRERWSIDARTRESYGVSWCNMMTTLGYGGVIWLNMNRIQTSIDAEYEAITTFAHELAHVFTRSVHGWVWRRMCTMLTVLAYAHIYDQPKYLTEPTIREITRTIVHTYYATNMYEHYNYTFMCDREINRHTHATLRMIRRIQQYAPNMLTV